MKKRLVLLVASLIASIGLLFFLCACNENQQIPSIPTEIKAEEGLVEESVEVEKTEATTETIPAEVQVEEKSEPKKEELPPPPAQKEVEEEASLPPEQNVVEEKVEKANTCFISVSCDTILKRPELLAEEKKGFLPADGKILAEREVPFEEGENAFDILLRILKEEKIHIEFMVTPLYDSVYIEGIGNIYEMDCGKLSGWMYKVNGNFLQMSSSVYQPKRGDKIEWIYTCDAGKDIGDQ